MHHRFLKSLGPFSWTNIYTIRHFHILYPYPSLLKGMWVHSVHPAFPLFTNYVLYIHHLSFKSLGPFGCANISTTCHFFVLLIDPPVFILFKKVWASSFPNASSFYHLFFYICNNQRFFYENIFLNSLSRKI